MKTLFAESIAAIAWDDTEFWGFRWENQEDVALLVVHPSAPGARAEIKCRWVSDLRVDLEYAETGGALLVGSGEVKRTEDRWTVAFAFRGHGSIALTCNHLSMPEPSGLDEGGAAQQ